MTKKSNVLSLVENEQTYELALLEHLDALTEEERQSKVNGMVVFGVQEGLPFYTVVEPLPTLECIGLLEEMKYFLIMSSMEGE